jgi:hypothetical protein
VHARAIRVLSLIPQSNPIRDWAVKYRTPGNPLPLKRIALYGRQILEVCVDKSC